MIYKILVLVVFSMFTATACGIDVESHRKGNIELFNDYFNIDKDFISDGYISLSIKPNLFAELKKNECNVFADFDYVLNNSTSFSVLLRDLKLDQLFKQKIMIGKADKDAVIAFLYGNVKGSCRKDVEMVLEYGYSFNVADILKKINGVCGRARSIIPTGVNPVPAREVTHRVAIIGQAEVTPNVKHDVRKAAGRKRKLK